MSLHQLVVDAAARYPDRPALSGAGGTLSYAELDRRADVVAARLRTAGVVRGDRVAIWAQKSPAVVVAMQAVLRLGAAYVPVDPATPAARAAVLVRDCAARLICGAGPRPPELAGAGPWPPELAGAGPWPPELAGAGPRAVRLAGAGAPTAGMAGDEPGPGLPWLDTAAVPPGRVEPVNARVDDDDPAFILYTSGSTGVPKGVCISHRNARSFVDWAAAELDAGPRDRFANHAALTFDLSVLDLYAAFARGGMVRLIPSELAYAPRRLVELLHRDRISVWYSVPSALTLMIREGGLLDRPPPAALRAVLFAGEPFPIAQVRRLAGWTGARLLNLYGPTETNVCTFREVTPADLGRDRPAPIGVPASGDRVWAVGGDGRPAAVGEEGELWVDGPTVMLGYWGRERHRGPYRTGDIVRVLPGGAFDYVGRRDLMVKVRGYRVELGDVESALAAHPDVEEAAVVTTGAGAEVRLEAFVVPAPGRTPGVLALKRHSAEHLPPYMIADRFHIVAGLPRTGNGKVDRVALSRYDHDQPAGEPVERAPRWAKTS
ncbi:amino acid adenylation domain-containing protein [Plantactinospora siamensis]|uniref:Amino acid adenylation domain-containing protein n=1 Tax=Plantactinospora siamensis TaxID=555372 RepID=A0ABV6P4F5_9ACTN